MIATSTIPIDQRSFDDLLATAVRFHGHLCPGQVLGVRMTMAGCREVGIRDPGAAGKSLVVIVEIDRCATDAIQALTGVSLGKRTLKHVDFGKMAATFVNRLAGEAARVVARDSARLRAAEIVPDEPDLRRAQAAAYRVMPETDLLSIERVVVHPALLERRRARVRCRLCGEDVNYEREVRRHGVVLCRACGGERYYRVDGAPVAVATARA